MSGVAILIVQIIDMHTVTFSCYCTLHAAYTRILPMQHNMFVQLTSYWLFFNSTLPERVGVSEIHQLKYPTGRIQPAYLKLITSL